MSHSIEVVAGGARLGECPLWSNDEGVLYWIDIDDRAIRRLHPGSGEEQRLATAGRPGSLALTATPGRLLVAAEHQLGYVQWADGRFEPWLDVEVPDRGVRLNDGAADRAGRFVVGSMFADTAADRFDGGLFCVDPDGAVGSIRTGVGVANGLAFSPDGTTMYFADSLRSMVWAYDYDPDTGGAAAPREFVDFAPLRGFPDGACVDAEGCYWVAAVYGSALYRFAPDGRRLTEIELPVRKPTKPAFGGPDLAVMFVTSIADGRDSPAPGGSLLALDTGVPGLPEPHFG